MRVDRTELYFLQVKVTQYGSGKVDVRGAGLPWRKRDSSVD